MFYLAQWWTCGAFHCPLPMWSTRGEWNLMQSLTKDSKQCRFDTAFQKKFPFCPSVTVQVETQTRQVILTVWSNCWLSHWKSLKETKPRRQWVHGEAPRGGCRSPGPGVWGWNKAGLSLLSFGNTLLLLRWGQNSSLLLQHSSAPSWRNPMVCQLPK